MDPLTIMAQYAPASDAHGDASNFGFKLVAEPIPHRRYRDAMFRIAELHLRRRKHGVGGGLLIMAPSGA